MLVVLSCSTVKGTLQFCLPTPFPLLRKGLMYSLCTKMVLNPWYSCLPSPRCWDYRYQLSYSWLLSDKGNLPTRVSTRPHLTGNVSLLSSLWGQCRKAGLLTQNAWINEVHQAEIFKQVILDGGPRDEHPPAGIQAVQGLVSLILRVFKPVSLQDN